MPGLPFHKAGLKKSSALLHEKSTLPIPAAALEYFGSFIMS
jgi:hypothetical protein